MTTAARRPTRLPEPPVGSPAHELAKVLARERLRRARLTPATAVGDAAAGPVPPPPSIASKPGAAAGPQHRP